MEGWILVQVWSIQRLVTAEHVSHGDVVIVMIEQEQSELHNRESVHPCRACAKRFKTVNHVR